MHVSAYRTTAVQLVGLFILTSATACASSSATSTAPSKPPAVAQFQTVNAREINLVDEEGKTHLRLAAPLPQYLGPGVGTRRSKNYGIQFLDNEGREIGGVGTTDRGTPGLCFDYSQADNVRGEAVCIGVNKDTAAIWINGPKQPDGFQPSRILLDLSGGVARIQVFDQNGEKGKPRVELRVDKDGKTQITGDDPKLAK